MPLLPLIDQSMLTDRELLQVHRQEINNRMISIKYFDEGVHYCR
jgi:hypothetical protein